MASPPAASKAPAPVVAKAPLFKQAAKVGDKTASPPQDAKVAKVASTN